MASERVTIKNLGGLHLRLASILRNKVIMLQSLITFKSGINPIANAKSVLSVSGVCVKYGDEIEFVREGNGEVEVLAATIGVVRDGLGEQDFQESVIE